MTRSRSVAALALLGLLAVGCAAQRAAPVPIDAAARTAAYHRALAARDALAAVEVEFSAWPRWRGRGLPGTHARLLLAAPEAARLRIASAFGTALDCAARAGTLTAYLPARRQAVGIAHAADSLGAPPAEVARRVFAASWRPPAAAWQDARSEGALQRVSWREAGDSLSVALDAGGLPVTAWWRAASGVSLEVRYHAWTAIEGARWPQRMDVAVEPAGVEVAVKVSRARAARGDAYARTAFEVPGDVAWITAGEIGEALRGALERDPQ